ncbi:hypothetical protein JRQ81_006795 [Phrynocephalus forsythii]|uniref:Uncharacterized protein n=1 Tax=Phrynocephalus forsythii TaxID=171643 RepID=A0A9Q0XDW3_9SAUR|nr:hypothetical protein JRQ81_006795 [Phrynocephalus forsythii]
MLRGRAVSQAGVQPGHLPLSHSLIFSFLPGSRPPAHPRSPVTEKGSGEAGGERVGVRPAGRGGLFRRPRPPGRPVLLGGGFKALVRPRQLSQPSRRGAGKDHGAKAGGQRSGSVRFPSGSPGRGSVPRPQSLPAVGALPRSSLPLPRGPLATASECSQSQLFPVTFLFLFFLTTTIIITIAGTRAVVWILSRRTLANADRESFHQCQHF